MAVREPVACSDEIRIKGIRAHGYGQIAKLAVLDPALTIEAKAILGYFCSYCGGGSSSFPGRDRIVHDLGTNKDTYYKHFNLLKERGYISVEQAPAPEGKGGFCRNVYTIENFPAAYEGGAPEGCSSAYREAFGKVKAVSDISAAGYGIVPKSVMTSDISVKAKGLYVYLCAFSGQDFTAMPSKDMILSHLGISHNSANKYMTELEGHNLISRVQTLVSGKFSGYRYYLNQMPEEKQTEMPVYEENSPQPNFSDTVISDPEPKISDTQFASEPSSSDTGIPDTQNRDANIPNSNTTKNNNPENNLSINHYEEGSAASAVTDGWIDYNSEKNNILDEIISRNTLPYEYMGNSFRINAALKVLTGWDERTAAGQDIERTALYKNFITALTEMMTAGEFTTIRGASVSYSKVYQALVDNHLEISRDEYFEECTASLGFFPDECIDYYREMSRTHRITDTGQYMKAIIWTKIKEAGTGASSRASYELEN